MPNIKEISIFKHKRTLSIKINTIISIVLYISYTEVLQQKSVGVQKEKSIEIIYSHNYFSKNALNDHANNCLTNLIKCKRTLSIKRKK